jgi:hypothetical protein
MASVCYLVILICGKGFIIVTQEDIRGADTVTFERIKTKFVPFYQICISIV